MAADCLHRLTYWRQLQRARNCGYQATAAPHTTNFRATMARVMIVSVSSAVRWRRIAVLAALPRGLGGRLVRDFAPEHARSHHAGQDRDRQDSADQQEKPCEGSVLAPCHV